MKLNVNHITKKTSQGVPISQQGRKKKPIAKKESCNQTACVSSRTGEMKCWTDISKVKDEMNDETGDEKSELKERLEKFRIREEEVLKAIEQTERQRLWQMKNIGGTT